MFFFHMVDRNMKTNKQIKDSFSFPLRHFVGTNKRKPEFNFSHSTILKLPYSLKQLILLHSAAKNK